MNPFGNAPTEQIGCPFCGSVHSRQVRQRADIVQCESCNTVYLRTRLTKDAMYQLYQQYADGTSHMHIPATVAEAKQSGLRRDYLIDEITSHTKHKGVWLDVGCGWGAMLDNVRQRGFSPLGIELTRACADFATMQLQIPVSNVQLEDSRIEQNSCSVLSMVHVLEHLPYPKQALKRVYDILEPGGMFCGIVPNILSFCSDVQQEHWEWLDPFHHYVHYTPSTLRKHLEDAGFIIENMYTASGDYGKDIVANIVKQLLPQVQTQEDALGVVDVFNADGKGEEIRFFVRKPESSHQAQAKPDAGILDYAHRMLAQIQQSAGVQA
ncbi:MAG: class I SAM-dependent methyltransferase [Candidatus Kapaibacterium sp.]